MDHFKINEISMQNEQIYQNAPELFDVIRIRDSTEKARGRPRADAKPAEEPVYDPGQSSSEDSDSDSDFSMERPHKKSKLANGTPKPILRCPQCPFTSRSKAGYTLHMKSHAPKTPCQSCSKLFNSQRSLEAHVAKYHSHTEFKCVFCDQTFWMYDDMVIHGKSVHPGLEYFKCPKCPYFAHSAVSLHEHKIKAHTVKNPFKCNKCDYIAPKAFDLRLHLQKHHNFKCELCGKIFTQPPTPNNHQCIHGNKDDDNDNDEEEEEDIDYFHCEICPSKCVASA